MTIGARLINDGTLITAGSFDETAALPNKHRITADTIFADELDEVTTPTGYHSGGSIALNGSNQRINVAGSGDFQFGTGDFTVEGWFFLKSVGYTRLWCFPDGDNLEINGTSLYYWNGGGNIVTSGTGIIPQYQWFHVALVKSAGVVNVYVNGTSRITDNNPFNSTSSRPFSIGGEVNTDVTGEGAVVGADGWLDGYVANVRVIKGTALYTTTFSTPIAPFSAVTNTKLLLLVANQANLLTDSSGTNKTVTNVGGATFSATTPLSTVYNGAMKQLKSGTLQVANEFDEITVLS